MLPPIDPLAVSGPDDTSAPETAEPDSVTAEATSALADVPVAAQAVSTSRGDRPGRISKPMIAAATTAGVVLMGLPLVLSQLGGGGSGPKPGPPGPPTAGFTLENGDGNGFVPSTDSRGNALPPAAGLGAGLVLPSSPTPSASRAPKGKVIGSVQPQSGSNPGQAPARQPAARPKTQAKAAPKPAPRPRTQTGTGSRTTTPRPTATKAAAPPAKATYKAVAGPWCTNPGTGFENYGWFDQGEAGWKAYYSGGVRDGNCKGNFVSVPMTGVRNKDGENSTVWTFTTGRVSKGSCRLSVYVPANGSVRAVGGNPTYYTVQNNFAPRSGTIGSFTVKQTANRGAWVPVGTYPVTNGRIAVMMHDRGQDWVGARKTYDHHAASGIRADCTA
ncbi:hypothetical protein [Streptomyces sp. NPDC058548]|uniref:hypothetical protein n=1 Tax=unclassified Streptomyces TaxID=2593676 RepID=UPI00365840C0